MSAPQESSWIGAPGDAVLQELAAALGDGLQCYWDTAATVLADSPIRLQPLSAKALSVERNFFSALFLYALHRGGLPPAQRAFAVAVNQCLRGLVTACDNLLDDEYKPTLETDLPPGSTRFRSVIDLLASDRVLFALLLERGRTEGLEDARLLQASAASLAALVPSGVQEAEEEAATAPPLPPAAVQSQIHHAKTGLLFQCVFAVPEALGDLAPERTAAMKQALYQIGMGSQLLDDLVDWPQDCRQGRQNYLTALVVHQGSDAGRAELQRRLAQPPAPDDAHQWLGAFPAARRATLALALSELQQGLSALLAPEQAFLVAPATTFLLQRIGGATLASFLVEAPE